jgi:RND family efflux transporter MFP subunit
MNETKTNEEQLRAEIESLKRQLAEQKKLHEDGGVPSRKRPSGRLLAFLAILIVGLTTAGFFAGYVPRQRREQVLAAESQAEAQAEPIVNVAVVKMSEAHGELTLPGNIQAVTEAPVMARASGFVRKRAVDIGDRVTATQTLAEIEAPELDQQILQAKATLGQANSAVEQAEAAVQQGRTNAELARVTAQRWANLFGRGVVSRQENDTYQAQYAAQQANVDALEKAVAAARSNVSAVEANIARLTELKGYQTVKAPFAGVITVRNVDTGALVNEGNTLLFRIAQTGTLRTYVNLPQGDAESVHVGQAAMITVPELPGRKFAGTVTRTSNALDPTTRTLLTEVQVPNPDGRLLPGMYAQVDLQVARKNPVATIPGDTLVIRSDGPQVAVVGPERIVHFTRIQLGRDYGDHLEVLAGLQPGQQLVVNPSDAVREGARVKPAALEKAAPAKP